MSKAANIFTSIGILLILLCVILSGYNICLDITAEKLCNDIINDINDINNQNASEHIPDYILNPNMDMPIKTSNGVSYIGALQIPDLETELPIAEVWNYKNLKTSPCRYSGSAYLDNMIICAHNYNSHFGAIKSLHIGDTVKFTDIDGNIFTYSVAEVEILKPTDIELMNSGEWDLTLFTCTIGGQARVTVRCIKSEATENTKK